MTFEIISTGSKGNAVVVNGNILVDCGVPFSKLREVKKGLKLVLLSHCHSDHFNPSTIRSLHRERPTLRFGCCSWMVAPLIKAGVNARSIDVFVTGSPMFYKGIGCFEPVLLTHDVPNCGWKMLIGKEKAFYATDTGTLDGVDAKDYDLYLVEANHTKAEIEERYRKKLDAGQYSYEARAAANHLSLEQTMDWIAENAGPSSKYVLLHQHEGSNGTD